MSSCALFSSAWPSAGGPAFPAAFPLLVRRQVSSGRQLRGRRGGWNGRLGLIITLLAWPSGSAWGQPAAVPPEAPPRPQPNWVERVDLGSQSPELAGMTALAGLQVREVARSGWLDGVAALALDAEGQFHTLAVVPSRPAERGAFAASQPPSKSHPNTAMPAPPEGWSGRLVRWHDRDGDGVWESPELLRDDLAAPQGLLWHAGWFYGLCQGRLLRWRPSEETLENTLTRAAEAGRAPPTLVTLKRDWLEQELLRGVDPLAVPAGGLSVTPQGWLYLAVGSGRHRIQSWDGGSVAVPASGAVLRLRPDGTQLELWARGLLAPTAVSWDSLGNVFLADAGGEEPFPSRLIQLWEGADYGWRQEVDEGQAPEVGSALPVLPRFDPWRGGDPARRAGCLPPILTWRAFRPAATWLWLGDRLDPRLRGQWLVADEAGQAVHVFGLQYQPTGVRVAWQFPLLEMGRLGLTPTALAEGPDGALYVAARPAAAPPAAGQPAGRIFRVAAEPVNAAPAPALNRFRELPQTPEEELLGLLETSEGILRQQALEELLARASRDDALRQQLALQLVAQVLNATRPPAARALALAGLCRLGGPLAQQTLPSLLSEEDPEIARLAAEAMGELFAAEAEGWLEAVEAIEAALGRARHPGVERALRLALGRLAAAAARRGSPPAAGAPPADPPEDALAAAEWGFESMSVTDRPRTPRLVFDAHVRALERVPGAARVLLLGNLDVAINFPQAEERERERIKDFVVRTAEAMRTEQLADFLNALLAGEDDLMSKLEPERAARLIACYRLVESSAPPDLSPLRAWLERHPDAPAQVQLAGLETVAILGRSQDPPFAKFVRQRLADHPELARQLAQRLIERQAHPSLRLPVQQTLQREAAQQPDGPAARLLEALQRAEEAPAGREPSPGKPAPPPAP